MNRVLAGWGKRLAGAVGLRVRRVGPENRFDAMADALRLLRTRGLLPRVVIDGGANVGVWTLMASAIFPEANFHLIEPQPACHARLARLESPTCRLHRFALTAPGATKVAMMSAGGAGISTGTFVVKADATGATAADVIEHPATTLDALLADSLKSEDRALLKLDLEGHEIEALKGADAILSRIEVVVSEVAFFDVYGLGHVLFKDVSDFLYARGFELYDFAALAPRPRDQRLRQGDAIFVRSDSALLKDVAWE